MGSFDWWNYFSDDVLNGLIQRAQVENLPLKEAFERIVEARSNLQLQGAQLKPNGDLIGEYQFSKRSGNARPFVAQNSNPFDLFRLGLDTRWELDLFGKIKRSIEAANSELKLQEYEYEFVRQTLLSDIAVNYLRIRLLQNQIILVEENLSLQQQTMQLVRERNQAGVSTELDEQQTEAFSFRTRALLSLLQKDVELEFNQLAILLGQVPNETLKMEVGVRPLPMMPEVPQYGIPASLLTLRPDVKREEMAVMAATANIGVAEADLYPQISLLGAVSVSAQSVSALFETNGLAFSVGPSFTWNILHFNRIHHNIDIQESKLRQALIRYQDTVLNAVKEVEDSLISQEGFRRQWTELNAATAADQRAVELSLERYRSGNANFQRVLDAQQQLLTDRRMLAEAQSNSITETVRLFKAAGGWSFVKAVEVCPNGSCGSKPCRCTLGQPADAKVVQQTVSVPPAQVIPNHVYPLDVAPSQIVPNEFIPNQYVPGQFTPGQAVPDQVIPEQFGPTYLNTPMQNSYPVNPLDQTAQYQLSTGLAAPVTIGVPAFQTSTITTSSSGSFETVSNMSKNVHFTGSNATTTLREPEIQFEPVPPVPPIPDALTNQATPLSGTSSNSWQYGQQPQLDSPSPQEYSVDEDEPFSIDFENLKSP